MGINLLRKQTASRRKAIITRFKLPDATTWPDLIDAMSAEDEMIFQIKLANLREKYGTKSS